MAARISIPPPTTLIVIGRGAGIRGPNMFTVVPSGRAQRKFAGRSKRGERDRIRTFSCAGRPRLPWPEFWKEYQSFG